MTTNPRNAASSKTRRCRLRKKETFMYLTPEEKAMAQGEYGPGIRRCMEILVKFGKAVGATELIPIASAHTMPKEPLQLLREMTDSAQKTGTLTTLHPLMSAFSPVSWQSMGLPQDFVDSEMAEHQARSRIYSRCGFQQTYCCLPMLVGNLPLKGQPVSWIGSGAQLMANSLLGARCNRDGAVVNLAAAMTGRAPRYGMFLDENRFAQVVVRFDNIAPEELTISQLGAVGYHVGALAGGRNVVFDGIPQGLGMDRLKHLMAPLPVSGAVCLCHVVGTTPEAPTLDAAVGNREPELTLHINHKDIRAALNMFTAGDAPVDLALFGCPHCTIAEIQNLSSLLSGKRVSNGKRLWIGAGHQMYHLANLMGCTDPIEEAGGVFASSCMATIPDAPLPEGVRVIATNSFKAAHYISRLSKGAVKVVIRDMEHCVAAVTGDS